MMDENSADENFTVDYVVHEVVGEDAI